MILKITGKDSLENSVIEKFSYQKKHYSVEQIKNEVSSFHDRLKLEGFFTSVFRSLTSTDSIYNAKFLLGKRTENIVIKIPNELKILLTLKDTVKLRSNRVESFLEKTIKKLDNEGKSFSKIQLSTPRYINKELYFDLIYEDAQRRVIDKVVLKGYEDFPKSFLKHHYNLRKNNSFSTERLSEVSSKTKLLSFVDEIKPPEVLFKKDSTILYLFLKKKTSSSIDGIINFNSKENGQGIFLNGHLDLQLNNALNTGERFKLFWNRVGNERSEFRLSTDIPYIFNSSISTQISFNIYRQDSTFLNTKFQLSLSRAIGNKSKVSFFFNSEKSNYLLINPNPDFTSYSNYFLGSQYEFTVPNKNSLYPIKTTLSLKGAFGNRNTETEKSNQFKTNILALYNLDITSRSYIYIKNDTGILLSKNNFLNELYRIGGANSIRGFNEQSIFTNRYTISSFEYRYVLKNNSYLHTISDIAFYNNFSDKRIRSLLGLGLGYSFILNNNFINLGYASGICFHSNRFSNNSMLIIKWTSFF